MSGEDQADLEPFDRRPRRRRQRLDRTAQRLVTMQRALAAPPLAVQLLGEVDHLEVQVEGADHVDGVAGAEFVQHGVDRRVVAAARVCTARACEGAQPLDPLERARERVRAQHVADEPAEERDARAKRSAVIGFDEARFIRGCRGLSSYPPYAVWTIISTGFR